MITVPKSLLRNGLSSTTAPSESSFTTKFGTLFPPARFLNSGWGTTAFYDFPPKTKREQGGAIQRVLFIHGICTPALGLLQLASKLHAKHPDAHFVLYDLWGHGLSSTPLVPHAPALFHAQITQLLLHLQWPSAHIVGFSYGGSTAVTFTAYNSDHVDSLSLIAPAGLMRLSSLTTVQLERLHGDDEAAAQEVVLKELAGGPPIVPEGWEESFRQGIVVRHALWAWELREHEGHVASLTSMFREGGIYERHDEFRKVSKLGVKSIVVLGEIDDVCSEEDIEDVGFGNVVVVPGADHEVVRVNAAEVASAIDLFWRGVSQG